MIETYTQNTEYNSIYTYIKRFNIGKFGYYIKQKYHNTRGNSSGKHMYAAKSTTKSDAHQPARGFSRLINNQILINSSLLMPYKNYPFFNLSQRRLDSSSQSIMGKSRARFLIHAWTVAKRTSATSARIPSKVVLSLFECRDLDAVT